MFDGLHFPMANSSFDAVLFSDVLPTWLSVAARASRITEEISEPNRNEPEHNFADNNNPSLDNIDAEPAPQQQIPLSGKTYVDYAYKLAYFLAITCFLSLCLTFFSVHRSLTDAVRQIYDFSILPSFALFTGECHRLFGWNIGIHFVVNILGSVIFGISAYVQQLCTTPNYHDIHDGIRPDSGDVQFGSILPFELLRRHKKKRFVVWLLLIITSLPIHFVLNSAFGYLYQVHQLSASVVNLENVDALPYSVASWTNITGSDCRDFCNQVFGGNPDVLNITLVVNNTGSLNVFDYFTYSTPNGSWVTNENLQYIEYCFENRITAQCSITLRWAPLLIFSGSLSVKVAVILLSLRHLSHLNEPLYNSIGDLLDLANSNSIILPTSECLLDKKSTSRKTCREQTPSGVRAQRRKIRYFRLMGISEHIFYLFQLFSLSWVWVAIYSSTVSYLPIYSAHSIFTVLLQAGFGTPFRVLWELPILFGALDSWQLTFLVFIANSPQLWFSIWVFLVNNHIVRIWLETDWRSYYLRLKRPRISRDTNNSEPGVRKPRVLQLPYFVTFGTMSFAAVGHWLISESFFVVETTGLYGAQQQLRFHLTHSPGPIAIGALLFSIVLLCLIINLFVGRWTWMPIMNGSVRVVLASCLRLKGFPAGGIAWGDVSDSQERMAGFAGIVGPLLKGAIYPEILANAVVEEAVAEPLSEGPDSDGEDGNQIINIPGQVNDETQVEVEQTSSSRITESDQSILQAVLNPSLQLTENVKGDSGNIQVFEDRASV